MVHEERLKAALADRYLIEREIGSGGMATVYLAQDLKHRRRVAVKVLDPDLVRTLGADRFLREIETVATLTHPHILPLFDSGEADGFLFYVMPFMKGQSLRARLTKEKQLPVEDAIRITREIADALAYAHEEGVIHRDVKPANIMLEAGHAVLADFGVAHAVAGAGEERLTATGLSVGTPAYMSPEQATGEQALDGRSDQYALGCVLYEMLAGQPPFTGASAESVVRQQITADPPDITIHRPAVPSGVAESLKKSLAKTPADRFQIASEFGDVLAAQLHTPPNGIASVRRGRRRRWLGLGAVGTAAIALGVLLIFWHFSGREEAASAPVPPPYTILASVEGSAPEELRDLVRSLLADDIDASGVFLSLPESQVRSGLRETLRPDTTLLTVSVARDLAERGSVRTVFAPRLDKIGAAYALTVRILEPRRDSLLAVVRLQVAGEDELLNASKEVVERLAGDPALAGTMVQVGRPFRSAPAYTPSLEAYRRWEEGRAALRAYREEEAIRLFREALRIDPEFAYAWSSISTTFRNMEMGDSADQYLRKALEYPHRLSPFQIATYEAVLAGDMQRRVQIYESRYLDTGTPTNSFAVWLTTVDRFEDAVAIMEQLEDQSPFDLTPLYYQNWAVFLLVLGRVEDAERVAAKLRGTRFEHVLGARIAAHKNQWFQAEEQALAVVRDPAASVTHRGVSFELLSSVWTARGRVGSASEALQEWMQMEERLGRKAPYRVAQLDGLTLKVVSEADGEVWPLDGLEADTTEEARALMGLWAAELGDTLTARANLQDLPKEDLDEFERVSAQQALVALLEGRLSGLGGDWETAVRHLRPVSGTRAPRAYGRNQLLHWVLGDAEERLGNLEAAAATFAGLAARRYFGEYDHRSVGLTYSFAHRRAALLYTQLGDHEKAIDHWRAFLEAFTDPDPEFEWMVEEARAELERLQG
jgi:serine/threonine-protein kinase